MLAPTSPLSPRPQPYHKCSSCMLSLRSQLHNLRLHLKLQSIRHCHNSTEESLQQAFPVLISHQVVTEVSSGLPRSADYLHQSNPIPCQFESYQQMLS
ncbi:hypothetical protein DsansV1_C10g0100781 [Dioscorea sansibarensis]